LRRGLDSIERNAKVQVQLIEDILDTTRVVSGKLHLALTPLNFADVVRGAVDSLQPAVAAKKQKLNVDLGVESADVMGDPDRLQQVVWNLLSNAVKFTPPDGSISVTLRASTTEVELSVTDTGTGISADFLPHVFDRFRQQDTTPTRRHSGLGLGLALVRHLVMAHGGSVSGESEGEGRGATFRIRLPLDDDRQRQVAPNERPFHQPRNPRTDLPIGALTNMNVLLVEDDDDAREVLSAVLSQHGAVVVSVGTASEALAKVAASCPDLLLSDIGLPVEDGYQLIRAIRKRHSAERLPAVALTAHAKGSDEAMARDAGFQAHVSKPVRPPELIRILVAVAASSGLPRSTR
jgi:CheY-like chemotaxis protein